MPSMYRVQPMPNVPSPPVQLKLSGMTGSPGRLRSSGSGGDVVAAATAEQANVDPAPRKIQVQQSQNDVLPAMSPSQPQGQGQGST